MAIETVADAVSATKVLYQGRSNYLFANLDWWCERLGPTKRLQDVTTEDLDSGIEFLLDTPAMHFRKGVGVQPGTKQRSNGTINRYIGSLATMYKLLRVHRRLPRSFVSPIIKGLKLPEAPGKTLQVSLEDVHRLIAASRLSNNKKMPALIAVACTTGLRKGSIQDMCWGDIDLKTRTIDVGRTKNGSPIRSVLPTWAAAELARIRPENPEKHWEVFGRKDFRKAWDSSLERAGLPSEWTFHATRHIAASILAQSGASLVQVMAVLNHKTTSMALRYSHMNTKSISEAVTNAWG